MVITAGGVTQALKPRHLLAKFNRLALTKKTLDEVLVALKQMELPDVVKDVLEQIAKVNGTSRNPEVVAWALLLEWVGRRVGQSEALQRHALRLLRTALSGLDEGLKNDALALLAKAFPGLDVETWKVPAGDLNAA